MKVAVFLLTGLLIAASGSAGEPQTPWQPPWWKSRPMSTVNRVLQSPDSFIFLVRRLMPFATETEAKSFADKQPQVCNIRKVRDHRYHVAYVEPMDISVLVPANEMGTWKSPKAQFALFLALRKWYAHGDEIADGKFLHYQRIGHRTVAEARSRIPDYGEIVEITEQKDTGTVFARHRQAIDLVAEARPLLRMLELSFSDLIPEDIEPYRTIGPTSVDSLNVGGIAAPGVMTTMGYLLRTHLGQGASAMVMIPDAANTLDHDYLRHFVLERGVKVVHRNNQTIITSDDGKVFLWKAGPRRYYYLAGGDPEVLDAYLKKFPSVLPKDYAFDHERWLREEVRQTMGRLAKSVAEDRRNRYLTDYLYLCRFIEPIEGAPPMWSSFLPAKLTAGEREAHFAPIGRWWQKHRKDFVLRKGAPLSHARVMSLVPKKETAVKATLKAIRATTRPTSAP